VAQVAHAGAAFLIGLARLIWRLPSTIQHRDHGQEIADANRNAAARDAELAPVLRELQK
jgi:hypothetical protein